MTKSKYMKKILASVLLVLLLLNLCGCNSEKKILKEYELSSAQLTILSGENAQLEIKPKKEKSKKEYSVSWDSEEPSVAIVDQNGTVTGTGTGVCKITGTVTVGKKSAPFVCTVTVKQNSVPLEGISFPASMYNLGSGQTLNLQDEIVFHPANAAERSLIWTSSNEAIAKVSDGIVTPVSEGVADITATAKSGELKAVCHVLVSKISVEATGISFSESEYTVSIGGKKTVTPTILPQNATGYSISWTSTDPSIATVSGGEITGISEGVCGITAKLNGTSQNLSASFFIKVTNSQIVVPATGVTISPKSISVTLRDQTTHGFTAEIFPANCTEEPVWSVNDPSLISIDSKTGKFTVADNLPNGKEATVVVRCSIGNVYGLGFVYITKGNILELSEESLSLYKEGPKATAQLLAAMSESDELPDVVWISSDRTVAEVDQLGNVRATGVGTCEIKAFCEDDPTMMASCRVTVEKTPYLVVSVGETITLDAEQLKIPEEIEKWTYDLKFITIDEEQLTITGLEETIEGQIPILIIPKEPSKPSVTLYIYVMPATE